MAFGKAFADARKAGKKEFTYNGKKYNTKTKDDLKKTPVPADKPSRAKSGATQSNAAAKVAKGKVDAARARKNSAITSAATAIGKEAAKRK